MPCGGILDHDSGLAGTAGLRRDTHGNEGARACGGDRKSVGDQPLIGRRDSVAVKAGLAGEHARGRQRFAGFLRCRRRWRGNSAW